MGKNYYLKRRETRRQNEKIKGRTQKYPGEFLGDLYQAMS